MKSLILILFFIVTFYVLDAQVNTNSINVPNTGANTTIPPMQITPQPNLSNPSNSTVPGANGSYSIDLYKPDFSNPNPNSTYTIYPDGTQGTTTHSPQTARAPD